MEEVDSQKVEVKSKKLSIAKSRIVKRIGIRSQTIKA